MSGYLFPRIERLHRTAALWPEWFFDVLHLATCELEAGPPRILNGALLFNSALPDTGHSMRSHVALVAAADGRDVEAAEAQAVRSSRQNAGWGGKVRAGIEIGIYSPRAQLKIGPPERIGSRP